jgi:hypothetical protein
VPALDACSALLGSFHLHLLSRASSVLLFVYASACPSATAPQHRTLSSYSHDFLHLYTFWITNIGLSWTLRATTATRHHVYLSLLLFLGLQSWRAHQNILLQQYSNSTWSTHTVSFSPIKSSNYPLLIVVATVIRQTTTSAQITPQALNLAHRLLIHQHLPRTTVAHRIRIPSNRSRTSNNIIKTCQH